MDATMSSLTALLRLLLHPYSIFHMRPIALLTFGFFALPIAARAQTAPHFYLGAGASLHTDRVFLPYSTNSVGPALTLGWQLSPRWAIQTGASFGRGSSKGSFNQDSASVTLGVYNSALRRDVLVVPLLTRFTVTAPTSRLHVDVLAGASWAHTIDKRSGEYVNATQPTLNQAGSYTAVENTVNLVLGPALRYTVGTRVDLTANSLLNMDFFNHYHYNLGNRIFLTTQLGVQYSFGR